jgi:hypothetical protein
VSASLRGVASRAVRPVGVALDRRFDALEERLMSRLDRLEERVAADVEAAAELTAAMRRVVDRLEARVAELGAEAPAERKQRSTRKGA